MTTLYPFEIPEAFTDDIETAASILKEAGCTEIYLFGSLTLDNCREDSDIDLAVRGCPRASFFHLLGHLMVEVKHRVDLVDLDAHDPFGLRIQQSGALRRIG